MKVFILLNNYHLSIHKNIFCFILKLPFNTHCVLRQKLNKKQPTFLLAVKNIFAYNSIIRQFFNHLLIIYFHNLSIFNQYFQVRHISHARTRDRNYLSHCHPVI